MTKNLLKFILIILDGFGLRKEEEGNAYALANTPILNNLFKKRDFFTKPETIRAIIFNLLKKKKKLFLKKKKMLLIN